VLQKLSMYKHIHMYITTMLVQFEKIFDFLLKCHHLIYFAVNVRKDNNKLGEGRHL